MKITEPTITCPNCRTEIWLTESLAAPPGEATQRVITEKVTSTSIGSMPRSIKLFDERISTERRDVILQFCDDGGIDLSGCDAGPLAEKMLGDWDYEFGVKLDADAVKNLCIRLRGELPEEPVEWLAGVLSAMYQGDGDAVNRFVEFCDSLQVPYRRWQY